MFNPCSSRYLLAHNLTRSNVSTIDLSSLDRNVQRIFTPIFTMIQYISSSLYTYTFKHDSMLRVKFATLNVSDRKARKSLRGILIDLIGLTSSNVSKRSKVWKNLQILDRFMNLRNIFNISLEVGNKINSIYSN